MCSSRQWILNEKSAFSSTLLPIYGLKEKKQMLVSVPWSDMLGQLNKNKERKQGGVKDRRFPRVHKVAKFCCDKMVQKLRSKNIANR